MMNCLQTKGSRVRRYLSCLTAGLLALLPLGAGAEEVPELLEPVGIKLNTVEARIGDLSEIEVYDASVAPYVEELYFSVAGKVDKVHVIVGQEVKAGDVLISLNQEEQTERMAAIREEIADVETGGAYDDELAALDLAILEVELEALAAQSPRDEEAIALKQLDIEERKLEQELTLQLRELTLSQLQSELAQLEAQVQEAVLTAPFDGRVMFLSPLESGSTVQGYDPLIYLADDTRLSVETAYIPGLTTTLIHRIYALVRDGSYDLTMVPINQEEYISQVLSGETVIMHFDFVQPDDRLVPGDYAALCVETNYVADALLIPANTLYTDSSGRYVYVLEDGERVRRNIKLGVITDWDVQVTEGLEEGAVVFVKD